MRCELRRLGGVEGEGGGTAFTGRMDFELESREGRRAESVVSWWPEKGREVGDKTTAMARSRGCRGEYREESDRG